MHYVKPVTHPRSEPIPIPWVMTVAEVLAPASGDRRTPSPASLDVRSLPPPDQDWLYTTLFPPVSFDIATWPAIDGVGHSFRAFDSSKIDTRSVPLPQFGWIERAYGCPQGPYFPQTAVNDASVGDVAWSNPGNATNSDDSYATCILVAQTSQNLQVTGFNFNISPDKRINGIKVEVECKTLLGSELVRVRLLKNGVQTPLGSSVTAFWETTEAFVVYDPNDAHTYLWGESWTPADINASNFGVNIRESISTTDTLSVDSVRVTVYCSDLITPPNGGYMTAHASVIDVRNIHSPMLPWLFPVTDAESASRIGIFDQEIASFRTRDPSRIEVQRISEPQFDWLYPNVLFDFTFGPGFEELLRSFRSSDRQAIDVRSISEPAFTWNFPVVDGATQTWVPTWYQEIGYRSRDQAVIDVRRISEPDFNWIFRPLNFDTQWWPGVEELLRSFRTPPGAVLDIRSVPEPEFGWIERGYGCPQGPYFPTSATSDDGVIWDSLTGTWDALSGTYPTWQDFTSGTTPGDIPWTNPQNALTSNDSYATVVLVAQTSKGLRLTGFNFNIPPNKIVTGILIEVEGKTLAGTDTITVRAIKNGVISTTGTNGDLTTTEQFVSFGGQGNFLGENWLFSDINAANTGVSIRIEGGTTATTSIDSARMTVYCADIGITIPPIYLQTSSAVSRRRPDVSLVTQPSSGWLFNALTPGFDSSFWPAIEQLLRSFTTLRSKQLDVRSINTPDISWLGTFFDPSIWPAIEQLLRMSRTLKPAAIDVRAIDEPDIGWLGQFFGVENWPAIEQLLRSYKTAEAKKIRSDIDEPDLTWLYPIVDANNAVLAAVRYVGGLRTRESAKIDVRAITEPDISWLGTFFDPAIWPAIEQLLRSMLTARAKGVNVASINEPDISWLGQFLPPTIDPALWPAIEELLRSSRTAEAKKLRLDIDEPDFTWVYPVIDANNAILFAAQYLVSLRTKDSSKLDVRSIDEPDISWLGQFLVPAIDPALWPAIEELLRSQRTGDGKKLDVRSIDEPDITTQLFPLVEVLAPSSFDRRTAERAKIDVRQITPALPAWIFKNLPVPSVYDDTMWSAIEELLRSYRTVEKRKLDVRSIDQPDFAAWYLQVAEALAIYNGGEVSADRRKIDVRSISEPDTTWVFKSVIQPPFDSATWPAIEELLRSYRARDRAKIDVTSITEPPFTWFYPTLDGLNAQYWPAIEELLRSYRTVEAKRIDVRSINTPDISWLGTFFDPSIWPAIEELLRSFRTPERAKVDVRAIDQPDTSWLNFFLNPTLDPMFWPAIEQLFRSYRTRDRAKIDVTSIIEPPFTWFYPIIDGLNAQYWPAIEELLRSRRGAERANIDVRSINTPDISWLGTFFDPAIWPAIEQLLRSTLTERAKRIDVTSIDQPDVAWLGQFLAPIFDPAIWPAIEQLLRSERTRKGAIIDVTSITEPPFTWPYPVISAIVAQYWPAIEELLRAFRSREGSFLNVRSVGEPSDGWLTINIPPPPPNVANQNQFRDTRRR